MRNFQDTFEKHKRSFISTFSICMTVSLNYYCNSFSWQEPIKRKKYQQFTEKLVYFLNFWRHRLGIVSKFRF